MFLVENVTAVRDAPKAEKFPSAGCEFVEKRHVNFTINGVEQGAVSGVEFLVAAAAIARVEDRVCCVAKHVGVAWIYPAKVR